MTQTERLLRLTQSEREALQSVPVIRRALAGEVSREVYVSFLTQAYHHVRHTVPLMMAAGARLTPRHHWLQKELVHYIDEELGHEEWVLNDIAAAGGDAEAVRAGTPMVETDAMVAYAYDTVMRRNPVGFFGMAHVLEGTSVALALAAADAIQRSLHLPDRAFSYLRSHGRLDQEHVGHLASVLDRLDADRDLPDVLQCARTIYWLYAGVFRGIDRETQPHAAEAARRIA